MTYSQLLNEVTRHIQKEKKDGYRGVCHDVPKHYSEETVIEVLKRLKEKNEYHQVEYSGQKDYWEYRLLHNMHNNYIGRTLIVHW